MLLDQKEVLHRQKDEAACVGMLGPAGAEILAALEEQQ